VSEPERKAPAGTIAGPCLDTTWQTPPELLEPVRAYFGGRIPFDAASTEVNPTGADVFAHQGGLDGLVTKWRSGTFVNPPYGRVLREWFAKMASEAASGVPIISLLPCARWEQRYFQLAYAAANAKCLIRKRVAFIRPSTGERVAGNCYANMFLAFNVDWPRFSECFGKVGACVGLQSLCGPPDEASLKPVKTAPRPKARAS
jgi:hypothetical protein